MTRAVFSWVFYSNARKQNKGTFFLRAPFVFNSPGQGWSFALSFGERFAEKPGELLSGFGFAFG
jgi:hypothetical protein